MKLEPSQFLSSFGHPPICIKSMNIQVMLFIAIYDVEFVDKQLLKPRLSVSDSCKTDSVIVISVLGMGVTVIITIKKAKP